MLLAQRVHRSTHGPASRCLSARPSTSRCVPSGSIAFCAAVADPGQINPESDDRRQAPFGHGALIRNEGAVGSNPITSTVRSPGNAGIRHFRG